MCPIAGLLLLPLLLCLFVRGCDSINLKSWLAAGHRYGHGVQFFEQGR